MRAVSTGCACGAACLQTQAQLPAALTVSISLIVLSILWIALRQWRPVPASRGNGNARAVLRGMLLWLAGGIAGFLWAAWLAHLALAPSLAPHDEGKDFIVTGTIDNLPYCFAQGVRFNFAVERVQDRAGNAIVPTPVPPRIAISWYSAFRDRPATRGAVGDVQPGERWRLTVRLQRPHGNANPYVCTS